MSTIADRERGTVRLFACGGAGTNQAQAILDWTKDPKEGFADLKIAFIDTSSSNMSSKIDPDDIYLIEGLDGSGQKRSQNHQEIIPRIKDIVQTFKPANLNIVLHSLSGGSGSVIGSLITKELMLKDHPVIVIGVGDGSTRLFTENTLKTLKTYESISKQIDAPVIMSYLCNRGSSSRKEIDTYVHNAINDLMVLFSNQNAGMDSQDLLHFLRYEKVTDYPSQLSYLTIGTNDDEEFKSRKEFGTPITVATLGVQGEDTDFPTTVEYHTEGFIPKSLQDVLYKQTVHYAIFNGLFDKISDDLEKHLKDIKEEKESSIKRKALLSDDDDVHDSGLVF